MPQDNLGTGTGVWGIAGERHFNYQAVGFRPPPIRIRDPFELEEMEERADEDYLEEVRALLASGHDIDALIDYIASNLFISREEAEMLIGAIESERQDNPTLAQKIQRHLRGEQVEGINEGVIKQYYDEEKKKRFITKGERVLLHKPPSDGELVTSSVKLDDILPD